MTEPGPGPDTAARTSSDLRTRNRLRFLRAVHEGPAGRTRSELTRELGLARGTASVLVAGLVEDELLEETPAGAPHTRGRPTGVPAAHPSGPRALAVDLREDSWHLALCDLGGTPQTLERHPHDGTPDGALRPLGAALRERVGPRVVGVGVSVPGPVRAGGRLDIAHLGWRDVDVAELLGLPGHLPPHASPHIVNDARLAALAEARRGALRGVDAGLHLHIDFDPGGTFLLGGRPVTGASGTAGEFGHMPLGGDDEAPCQCGAQGCWSLRVGANALLRAAGLPAGAGRGRPAAARLLAAARTAADSATGPATGRRYDHDTPGAVGVPTTGRGDVTAAAALAAVRANARALGAGLGALVNAFDPGAVTLSGMGVDLHALAREDIEETYRAGLMEFRRAAPPPLAPSALGDRGPLTGAVEAAFDAFLTPEGLTAWRARAARR